MSQQNDPKETRYLQQSTSRKVNAVPDDEFTFWTEHYQRLAVAGIRSEAVAQKIALHLARFQDFFVSLYGHGRLSACLRRDVQAWQEHLKNAAMAPATVNNHLASLSAFTTWVHAQNSRLFALGGPAKGIGELALPPLELRALNEAQVRSLKSICDRLPRLHQVKGRR